MSLIQRGRPAAVGLSLALTLLTAVPAMAAESAAPALPPDAISAPAVPAPPPAGAKAPAKTISREEVLATVRRYFAIPDGPGRLDASLSTYGEGQFWEIMYTITRGNSSTGYGLGQVDATTGRILHFQMDTPDLRPFRPGPLGQPYPEADAWLKATYLVREMYPEAMLAMRPAPDNLSVKYYGGALGLYEMTWMTYVGDIPDPSSYISVRMDKRTGQLLALNAQLAPGSRYLPAQGAIGAEAALAKFKEIVKPELVYSPVNQENGVYFPKPVRWDLIYQFTQATLSVDAVTGKVLDELGEEWQPAEPKLLPKADGAPVARPSLPLTRDQADEYLKSLLQVPADADKAQSGFEPSQGLDDTPLFSFNWYSRGGFSAGAAIDPQTGMIQYLRRQTGQEGWKPVENVTPEQEAQAEKAAIAAVQRYYPDLAAQVKLIPPNAFQRANQSQDPRRQFYFQRFANELPVQGNMIYVGVDLNQMDWVDIHANWTPDLTLPAVEGVLPAEEVAKAFLQSWTVTLQYKSLEMSPRPWGGVQPATTKFPVYKLMPAQPEPLAYLLDARTGKPVDWVMPPKYDPGLEAKLTHHWAGGELLYMVGLNAIPVEKLNPQGELNRQDGLQLLAFGLRDKFGGFGGPVQENPYTDMQNGQSAELIRQALNVGLLRPDGEKPQFGAEQPLTRAQFAVWVARAMGLGSLARSNIKTESGFADLGNLTAEERNAVTFLEAMGLVKPAYAFRGSQPITQAEAAAITGRLILAERNP